MVIVCIGDLRGLTNCWSVSLKQEPLVVVAVGLVICRQCIAMDKSSNLHLEAGGLSAQRVTYQAAWLSGMPELSRISSGAICNKV